MRMPEDLQWNDFQENLARSFRVLRDDQDFIDVTLVSGDGQQVGGSQGGSNDLKPIFQRSAEKEPTRPSFDLHERSQV